MVFRSTRSLPFRKQKRRVRVRGESTNDVTVGLSGIAATAAAGVLGVALSLGVVGNTVSPAAGTVTGSGGDAGDVVPVPMRMRRHPRPHITDLRESMAYLRRPAQRFGAPIFGGDKTSAITGVSGTGVVGTVAVFGSSDVTTPMRMRRHVRPDARAFARGQYEGRIAKRSGVVLYADGNITISLVGVQATSATGTLGPSLSHALTGTTGAVSVGTLSPATSHALTGNTASGAIGNITPTPRLALTGVSGTSATGTLTSSGGDSANTADLTGVAVSGVVGVVTITRSSDVTGCAASGAVGTLNPTFTHAITGNGATSAIGSVTVARSVTLSSVVGTGGTGLFLAAGDKSVALTGVSASATAGTLAIPVPPLDLLDLGKVQVCLALDLTVQLARRVDLTAQRLPDDPDV